MRRLEFPREMKKDSKGPHVTLLQGFLCGALPGSPTTGQLVYDQHFGGVTEQLVREFQIRNQLEVTGNWDQPTRGAARRLHTYDFEAACQTIPGITEFVQSDGASIAWHRVTGI